MKVINFIDSLILNFSQIGLFLKFNLILLFFFIILVTFSFISETVKFFLTNFFIRKKLVDKELKLINLRKKYLDGKINAREYKVNTIRIVKSIN
tara:strand:+ start:141 stop:422 length:282 start_codon:yes stop_codon:yes gene_type:complete